MHSAVLSCPSLPSAPHSTVVTPWRVPFQAGLNVYMYNHCVLFCVFCNTEHPIIHTGRDKSTSRFTQLSYFYLLLYSFPYDCRLRFRDKAVFPATD